MITERDVRGGQMEPSGEEERLQSRHAKAGAKKNSEKTLSERRDSSVTPAKKTKNPQGRKN